MIRPARLAVLVLACLGPAQAAAQEVRTAVVPDAANVGDIFRVAVRVFAPPGTVVTFPDTLGVPDNVEAAARRSVTVDSLADQSAWTAIYPLTAWRTGIVALPAVTIRVGNQEIEATIPQIEIASILPPDTAEIAPRPAKDVVGPSRLLWPIVLGILALAALLGVAIWLYRRRKPAVTLTPGVPPRDRALAELDRLLRLGHLERAEIKAFYTALAGVLRAYSAQLDPRWGAELTTTELWRVMARVLKEDMPVIRAPVAAVVPDRPETTGDGSNEAVELYSMLGRADLVKFAQARPATEEAKAVWTEARDWVVRFPPQYEPEPGDEGK